MSVNQAVDEAVENPSVRAMAKYWLEFLDTATQEQAARFAQYINKHPHEDYEVDYHPSYFLQQAAKTANITWRGMCPFPYKTRGRIDMQTGQVFIGDKLIFDPLTKEEAAVLVFQQALRSYMLDAEPTNWNTLLAYCHLLEAAAKAGVKQEDLPAAPFPVELADAIREVECCEDRYWATLRSCEGCGSRAHHMIQRSYDDMVAARDALPPAIAEKIELPLIRL